MKHTSCIIEKMTPNSVSAPVAMTTPDPRPTRLVKSEFTTELRRTGIPFRTNVPIYAIQVLSASTTGCCSCPSSFEELGLSNKQVSAFLLRACVSPVKLLSSISRSMAEIMRMSAGIRSPVEKWTTSPGTISFASIWIVCPSLRNESKRVL